MKRVLITGGSGFIGSNLVRLFMDETDAHVLNYDKQTYVNNENAVKYFVKDGRYAFVNGDICDKSKLEEQLSTFKPDVILHLAAETHVDNSIVDPEDFIHTNLIGTYTLLEAVRSYFGTLSEIDKKKFRCLHVSTDEVYGDLGKEDPPFTEESAYAPNSPYSATKAGSDHLMRAWHNTFGIPIIITKCSNNYGPYQFPEKLVPKMIGKALLGEHLPIYGNGENIRDWLFVDDHTRALLQVVQRGNPGDTYNIGGNCEITNLKVVQTICEKLDELNIPKPQHSSFKELIVFVKDRPGHDRRYAINFKKIERELGWRPKVSFEVGINLTIGWYLNNNTLLKQAIRKVDR